MGRMGRWGGSASALAMAATWALFACADEGAIRDRIDGLEVSADAGVDAVGDGISGDTGSIPDSQVGSDGTAQDGTVGDTVAPGDGGGEVGPPADTTSGDTGLDGGDGTIGPDAPIVEWDVDPNAVWALGRPIGVSGSEGVAEIAAPIATNGGRHRALVPVRVGGGNVVVDGRSFAAPDTGAHAAIVALGGELQAPVVTTVVYLDGPLARAERPAIAVCEGWVYATINEQDGSAARFVRLDASLEAIDVATLTAVPGLGHGVKLGAPVCGGPGVVATLDAIGGAAFTAPNGNKAEFLASQTENKSLILNGTRIFAENAAQVVSATGMRILHLLAGVDQNLFYVGEATIQRQIGDTTLVPGDQLIYIHDYAVGSGGSIASQAWFGREDITRVAAARDGRFAVVWVDVTPGPTPADPETLEVVVSVFEADGARAWNKRSAAWAIDRIAFDAVGDLRIAGRFRSLEVIGVATAPQGPEDAFLATLSGADGERLRFVTHGQSDVAAAIVSPIFGAPPGAGCGASGVLDAVFVATGATRIGIGVSPAGGGARCTTQPVQGGGAPLMMALSMQAATGDAIDFWLALADATLDTGIGEPWPAGVHVGPVRARFSSPW